MIKSKFNTEGVSVKLGLVFSGLGISPNTWTVMAIIPAFLGFLAISVYHDLLLGLILFIVSGIMDAIDGAVARVTRSISAMGAFLDGIMDRYVEILMYMGLLFFLFNKEEFFMFQSSFWIAILIFGALMPTYIRAYADHRGVVKDPEEHKKMGGIIERPERLTLLYIGMFLGLFETIWLIYVIAILAVMTNVTALQRIYSVIKYKGGKVTDI